MADWITRAEMDVIPATEISDTSSLPANPRVSVLMMTRNHAPYLREAVESVIAQECNFAIELLIGEDFSTDTTRQVAMELQKEFPQIVRLFIAERNVGITANFLRLVAKARGEYLAFLEGDDYWIRNDKLQKQVELMDANLTYSWCAAKTKNRIQWLKPKPAYNLEDILLRYIVHTSTVLFRASALKYCYPAFPDRVCWESMLLAYLTDHGLCGFIDEFFSYYRHHEGGLWHNAQRMNRISMSRDCIDAMNEYFNGRYRKQLGDREAWIYWMDTAPQLNKEFIGHWLQSFEVLWTAMPRLATTVPIPFVGLWIRTIFLPFIALTRLARQKLALRYRLQYLYHK